MDDLLWLVWIKSRMFSGQYIWEKTPSLGQCSPDERLILLFDVYLITIEV